MTFADLIIVLIVGIFSMVIGVLIGMLLINENIKQTCPELHRKWMKGTVAKEDAHE